ncbi:MAG: STAS domain-containing protein [Candidatus Latescibacterota bacterium]|nr:MAG: STAS domain-containing protein [Candidatus Latescibacterota bacterium]
MKQLGGRVAVVAPRGMLFGEEETTRFDREVRELLEGGVQVVIRDLSCVEYVGTAAIGLIQEKHLLAQSRGATLALSNVNRRTLETLSCGWIEYGRSSAGADAPGTESHTGLASRWIRSHASRT